MKKNQAWRDSVMERLHRFEADVPARLLTHLAKTHAWEECVGTRRATEGPHAIEDPSEPPEGSSARWTLALNGQDNLETWLTEGRERFAGGDSVAASVACAVAEWLEPESADVRDLIRESGAEADDLPPGAYQPDRPYRERIFPDRHWSAWAMKITSDHRWFGPLLANACDENFSVRTRIYRSLGQVGHPAAIQCLHEALGDPHPFARAQAIRSLGWIGDPSFVDRLEHLAESDPVADVRRIAAKTVQRIRGYWMHYGDWWVIARSVDHTQAVARELTDHGLLAFSNELYPLSN